ncbi:MAG: LCP family protein, partial [Acutalibacteraceae bacterium]
KLKLTSIARDTYVAVEGYGKTKITNAWRFGAIGKEKSGSTLAVKTLNQNFNLDIKDYVEVNFFQFSEIIDYVGGVVIDVDESEKNVMNVTYIPYINQMGIKCERITKTGPQLLSGGQALAYARDRYTGNDVTRGSRQREILIALYEKLKDTSATKYPTIISMMLSNCITSLSDSEIMSLASWAALKSPTIEELSLPNDECNASGQTIGGQWYYVYDLDNASKIIHNFIYEPEDASPAESQNSSDTSSSAASSKS